MAKDYVGFKMSEHEEDAFSQLRLAVAQSTRDAVTDSSVARAALHAAWMIYRKDPKLWTDLYATVPREHRGKRRRTPDV